MIMADDISSSLDFQFTPLDDPFDQPSTPPPPPPLPQLRSSSSTVTSTSTSTTTTTITTTTTLSSSTSPSQQQSQSQSQSQQQQQLLRIEKDAPELIILIGPPCSGRTYYYYQNLQSSHVRISATELFNKDSDTSFRSVIQNHVIKTLLDGKSVVIDDTNHLQSVRTSYVQALLKANVPISRISVLNFIPAGGEQQVQWATAWAYCERAMSQLPSAIEHYKPLDYDQFKAEYHVPNKREGFCVLRDVTTPLILNQHNAAQKKELTNVALFLDARAILRFADRTQQSTFKLPPGTLKFKYAVQLRDNIDIAIREWTTSYKSIGQNRVVLLIDEVALYPASVDFNDPITVEYYRKEIKKCIKTLSDQISFPVYYLSVPALVPGNDFYRFPNLGLFAMAQYRHRLSLQGSIVVVDDQDIKFSATLPFQVCLASKFFQGSTWSVETKLSKCIDNLGSFPTFLENIQFVSYDDIDGFVPEKGMPLFARVQANTNEKSTTEEHMPTGKRHGVFFPHEDHIRQSAAVSQDDIADDNDLSVINEPDRAQEPSNQTPPIDTSANGGKILPWVTNRFMVDFGIDEPSVYRGESYYKEARLSNIDISTMEPDYSSPSIKVAAQCRGTSPQPYSLMVRYRVRGNTTTSPILESYCSCPNGTRTYGKCKHIVALLYHCNVNLSENPTTNKVENIINNSPDKRNRRLPEWMSPNRQTTTSSEYKKVSPNKRTLNVYFPEHQMANPQQRKYGKAELVFEKPKNSVGVSAGAMGPQQTKQQQPPKQQKQQQATAASSTDMVIDVKQEPGVNPVDSANQFIQQLFGQYKRSNDGNSGVPDVKKDEEIMDVSTEDDEEDTEFCVPRSNSEETLRTIIQNAYNKSHEPDQMYPLSSQMMLDSQQPQQPQMTTTTNDATVVAAGEKKKLSLRQLLESQGIQLNLGGFTSTSSPTNSQST
ncbi:hypothetical protein SAMD00019534_031350 [Acytostelium subglobosum LB1]|uniref:hypothetical protein n=1 Tax=Acytostelium subglobosum LB1 TaxID=1410327 RepID=UPI0006450A00|nr:hypothetical protein SAMD00019534_031350 [Acytostelium subglobosum LB1]GAM19960.1 hypothetical protein SAMD00019534_031350 [Acytostelium subglobosum LB1]|eukprot:XP_012756722.1 hypothetical protein SAMD00019534_031350 [Acytostelium subglobosum LB1]